MYTPVAPICWQGKPGTAFPPALPPDKPPRSTLFPYTTLFRSVPCGLPRAGSNFAPLRNFIPGLPDALLPAMPYYGKSPEVLMNPLSRRTVLRWAALSGAPAVLRGRFQLFAQSSAEYSARAIQLIAETTVVDLLNQFRFADYSEKPPKSDLWLNKPGSFTAADAATYQSSGINVFALGSGTADYQEGLRFFAKWNGFLAAYSDWLLRIDDARDFARVRTDRKIGIMLT